MASVDGVFREWGQIDTPAQEMLLSGFESDEVRTIFDRVKAGNNTPVGGEVLGRLKAQCPIVKIDAADLPVSIFLTTLVSGKAKMLESYLSKFPHQGIQALREAPFKRYSDLNSLLQRVYSELSVDNLVQIDEPKGLAAEHRRAIQLVIASRLQESGKLCLELRGQVDLVRAGRLLDMVLPLLPNYKGDNLNVILRNFGITSDELPKILSKMPVAKLVHLDLSQNELDNDAVGHLNTVACHKDSILDQLLLNGNRIGDLGAVSFTDFLKSGRTVRLELRNNPISDEVMEGLKKIAEEGETFSSVES